MYCLDTDVIVEYLRGNPKIVERLSSIYEKGGKLHTTFINLCELYKGIYTSHHKEKEEVDINVLLYTVKLLEMNQQSCIFFGKEWNRLQKSGKQTQILDLMIASVSIANNLTFMTRNKKHYENIKGLNIQEL